MEATLDRSAGGRSDRLGDSHFALRFPTTKTNSRSAIYNHGIRQD
jgi:hypothetical protein